jgi:hypothetical protein
MSAMAPQVGKDSVSVVLNVFRRSANYEAQLAAIRAQTHPVSEILVWENGNESVSPETTSVHARSSKNLGVWARFAFALNATSDYIWMIDDDSIPGPEWLESALQTHRVTGGLVGSRGLRFRTTNSYTLYDEFGPNNPNSEIVEVDIVGHNWIFPSSWLGQFWSSVSSRFNNPLAGEDIHLSFIAQTLCSAGTFVPPHPIAQRAQWGEQPADEAEFGRDESAISSNLASMRKFEDAYQHYIAIGFRPLCIRDASQAPSGMDRLSAIVLRRTPKLAHRMAKWLGLKK